MVGEKDAPTGVGWHRDWTYFRKHWEPGSVLLTAWIALSDVEEVSGSRNFVVGSHRRGETTGGDFFRQDISKGAFSVPVNRVWTEAPALMPTGVLSLHDQYILHVSGPNLSDRPRRSLAAHVRTEKSRLIGGGQAGVTSYVDYFCVSPIIYGTKVGTGFS